MLKRHGIIVVGLYRGKRKGNPPFVFTGPPHDTTINVDHDQMFVLGSSNEWELNQQGFNTDEADFEVSFSPSKYASKPPPFETVIGEHLVDDTV